AFLLSSMPGLATGTHGTLAAKEAADSKLNAAPSSSSLAAAAGDFKTEPNDSTWRGVSQAIRTLLSDTKSARVPYSQLETANRELSDLGLKVIEAGLRTVCKFPRCPHAA